MGEWVLAMVLPNLRLAEPIEGGEVALVPRHDQRVTDLGREHANVGAFLERFTDAFGVPLEPTSLLARRDAPPSVYTIEAWAGIRDLVVASVVPRNRSLHLTFGPRGRILWSDTFAFYPWSLDKNHEYLVAQTPALMGLHVVDEFRGQAVPELPSPLHLDPHSIDVPLLGSLIERWRSRFLARTPTLDDRKLFRSLNMANQASRISAGSDTTFYDVGRSIALWVSAFEILAHTGPGGGSGKQQVTDLLDRNQWLRPRLRARRFKINKRGKKGRFAAWLYLQINGARNDFLHGNPATAKNLQIKMSGKGLFNYAAPLYRTALASFLDLRWEEEPPEFEDGGTKAGEWLARHMEFESHPRVIEEGLLTALQKSDPDIPKSLR